MRLICVSVKPRVCNICLGTGEVDGGDEWIGLVPEKCYQCKGKGSITIKRYQV